MIFSCLQRLSGGQVSNRQCDCEGNSKVVVLNTSRVILVSCKVLHVGENHLHEIVAFGGHQVWDNICKPMLESFVCWAEGVLMEENIMSEIKVVVRVFRLGLGHQG